MTANIPSLLAAALAALTLLFSLPARAQPKLPRIGILQSSSPTSSPHLLEAFVRGLRDLGHVDGRTVVMEYRWAHGKFEELPRLAAELVAAQVDVIFAPLTPATIAAKSATGRIPIVFAQVNDPVATQLVASLSRPGGNVTGVTTVNLELVGKRLELLKEVSRDRLSRVGLLFNPSDASNMLALKEMERVSRVLGLDFRPLPAKGPEELDSAFAAVAPERIDGLVIAAGSMTNAHARRIAALAATTRLPAVYSSGEFVDAGGLMAYAAVFSESYFRAAGYVDRILKGARPGELAIEQSSQFELVVNLATAKALRIDIPQAVLLRANRVIQ